MQLCVHCCHHRISHDFASRSLFCEAKRNNSQQNPERLIHVSVLCSLCGLVSIKWQSDLSLTRVKMRDTHPVCFHRVARPPNHTAGLSIVQFPRLICDCGCLVPRIRLHQKSYLLPCPPSPPPAPAPTFCFGPHTPRGRRGVFFFARKERPGGHAAEGWREGNTTELDAGWIS